MRVVILAAGMGRRLGGRVPKPLSPIAPGVTLLSHQVEVFSRLVGRDRIRLVAGHRAGEVLRACPGIEAVLNHRFAETNTARSLERGLAGMDDDVLWVNGDLYFDASAAETMLSARPDVSRCLVDRAPPREEAVKYTIGEAGFINRLAKDAPDGLGEALGMNVVIHGDLPALRDGLKSAADDDYFEKALETCAQSGAMRLAPVDAGDAFCVEVDYPADLERVRVHITAKGRRA